MNRQEVFDKVAAHLLRQGERSLRHGERCAYRGTEGRMCAIGCLIADEQYTTALEGMGVGNPHVADAVGRSGIPDVEDLLDMLVELQWVHDSPSHPPEMWRTRLSALAAQFGLEFKEDLYGAA